MPTRRATTRRAQLDEVRALQLLGGPDYERSPGGVGYLTSGSFDDMPEAEQQAVIEQMRADWELHGAVLTRWWNGDKSAFSFKPWNFIHPEPDELPWAAQEFGAASGADH